MDQLAERIRSGLMANVPFDELVDIVKEYKARGISQEQARIALQSLISSLPDEPTEDRLLELLDLVVGYCLPKWRIWETDG